MLAMKLGIWVTAISWITLVPIVALIGLTLVRLLTVSRRRDTAAVIALCICLVIEMVIGLGAAMGVASLSDPVVFDALAGVLRAIAMVALAMTVLVCLFGYLRGVLAADPVARWKKTPAPAHYDPDGDLSTVRAALTDERDQAWFDAVNAPLLREHEGKQES